ncbi:MAG: hypothetical protein LLG04_04075 [Parachlamydia sp.]|nr:hypothetical protein [Parachlamydia sp.]
MTTPTDSRSASERFPTQPDGQTQAELPVLGGWFQADLPHALTAIIHGHPAEIVEKRAEGADGRSNAINLNEKAIAIRNSSDAPSSSGHLKKNDVQ